MSWDAWADNIIANKFIKGAIIGYSDGNCWAQNNCKMSPEEIKEIQKVFKEYAANPDNRYSPPNGICIEGKKYMFLSCDGTYIQAKLGKGGVSIYKSTQAMIVGVYDENLQAGNALKALGTLRDQLMQTGY